jgi:hypothetical protein
MYSSAIKLFMDCRNADNQRTVSVANDYAVGSRFAQVIEMRNIPETAIQSTIA